MDPNCSEFLRANGPICTIASNEKFVFAGDDWPMQRHLFRLYWLAIDRLAGAVELARCWIVDRLCGPFPETPTDRAIRERGDRRFTDDPDSPRP
jgi:hypothetical protein